MTTVSTILRRIWLTLSLLFLPRLLLLRLPKIMLHEHLDCSLRPRTMLELMNEFGFPQGFPQDIRDRVSSGDLDGAASAYQNYLVGFASTSLAHYVQAVVDHILPLMQTQDALYRITKERIEDAVNDGIIGLELRFAPQLHTMKGLSLDQVMNSVIKAVDEAPIAVNLIVCALRHEDADCAHELADLAIKYKKHVRVFDLAADEHANSGVLQWWIDEALRVREEGIDLTIHLWETEEPTAEDLALLKKFAIKRVGHGIRGDKQGDLLLEVCPTSNVVTGQVVDFAHHQVDRLYRAGRRVTINTDGTLFTRVQLTDEYVSLRRFFAWGLRDFYRINATALEASSFSSEQKLRMGSVLKFAYAA